MKYYINQNARLVRANIDNCHEEATDYIMSFLTPVIATSPLFSNKSSLVRDIIRNTILECVKKNMHYSYWGKAVCSVNDAFSETKGKEIARARALEKYYRALRDCAGIVLVEFNMMNNHMEDCLNESFYNYDKWAEQVENI